MNNTTEESHTVYVKNLLVTFKLNHDYAKSSCLAFNKIESLKVEHNIVFVWSRSGANWTKALVKGLLAPEFNIVGGVAC